MVSPARALVRRSPRHGDEAAPEADPIVDNAMTDGLADRETRKIRPWSV
jgi:hypothetical protein